MRKIKLLSIATLAMLTWASGRAASPEPLFHHTFDTATDASGQYTGSLNSGATLSKLDGEGIVDLGASNGYFDFGTTFGNVVASLSGDYTISANLFIPNETQLGANGNFVFNFGKSSADGYAFFGANSSRYSITQTTWSGEQTVNAGTAFPCGQWVNLVIVQRGNTAAIYFDGVLKSSAPVDLHLATLGITPQNWLGRSPYNGDVFLKNAKYSDFRIYNTALTDAEIATLAADDFINRQNIEQQRKDVEAALAAQTFDFSNVRANLNLPASLGRGVNATWTSSNHTLIAPDGTVTRPAIGQPDGTLTLTLTATKGLASLTRTYEATVKAQVNDADALAYDLDNLAIRGSLTNLRSALMLPASTPEGSYITWKSSDNTWLSDGGKVMRLAPAGSGKHEVTLTATGRRNAATATRDFKVMIAEEEQYSSYLFAFFPSNDNENLYYAISSDGYSYTTLNRGQRVMLSDSVAIKKGIRDPHILRGPDGKTFYMVATDMKCAEGWDSNRGIVMYRSTDLINWEHHTVHFPDRFPEWKNVTRVWAPEVIWDQNYENPDGTKGRMLVYFSLLTNDGKVTYDKVYYCYANDDFSGLITDPEYFYDRGSATIDCDIIFDERDDTYHMVFKNEGMGGICQVTSKRLTPEPGKPAGSQWSAPSETLQQTDKAVEGAGMYRLINSDTWILMYDCYTSGYYQFCATDDLKSFILKAQTTTSGSFTPRHGTVMPITAEEEAALLQAFPIDTITPKITGSRSGAVRQNNFRIKATKVTVPVYPGVDISNFDPQLSATPFATVSPAGPQNFANGPIEYTVSAGIRTSKYQVTVVPEVNPVLPGFKADPEVMFSHKTGRFYIYPTTDGYPGWGGYQFSAFSSADLVNWQEENVILDLASSQVPWATGNAWAPCIEEKLVDGQYKYYFYFSGHNPSFNYKTLGCAVADSPTGPFTDLGRPMIDTNIFNGQLIDSDVMTDSKGDTYFYWGNGGLAVAKMNPDMTSITDAKVITPTGGTLNTYAFREGVYVFERNGIYYFLWSVDDTGARNYHVAYGTSTSPMGPIKVAASPIVLIQDAANEIYGTGHNSVLKIPGRDEWYIVYHRINKKYLSYNPGQHREVCIDRLEFNEDGTIKRVTPTHKGIDPVDMTDYMGGQFAGVLPIEPDNSDTRVLSTVYYKIDGTVAADPSEHGFYICTQHLSNGKMRSTRIMK